MDYIKSLKIERDYIPFKEGEEFEFGQINVIVGDQGCGKSTILSLLMDNFDQLPKDKLETIYAYIDDISKTLAPVGREENWINIYKNMAKALDAKQGYIAFGFAGSNKVLELHNIMKKGGFEDGKNYEFKQSDHGDGLLMKYLIMKPETSVPKVFETLLAAGMHVKETDIFGRSILVNAHFKHAGKTPDPKEFVKFLDNSYAKACSLEINDRIMENYLYFSPEKHNPRNLAEAGQLGSSDMGIIRSYLAYLGEYQYDATQLEGLYIKLSDFAKTLPDNDRRTVRVSEMDVLSSGMKSHGQVLLPLIKQFTESKRGLLFIDEPETALSIRSQHLIADEFQKCAENGCQLFIATHSQIIMERFGRVLSLEHRRWMDAKEFIKTQETHDIVA